MRKQISSPAGNKGDLRKHFFSISFSSLLPISESDLSLGKAGESLVLTSEGFVIHIFYTNFYYIKAFFIKAFQCKHQAWSIFQVYSEGWGGGEGEGGVGGFKSFP